MHLDATYVVLCLISSWGSVPYTPEVLAECFLLFSVYLFCLYLFIIIFFFFFFNIYLTTQNKLKRSYTPDVYAIGGHNDITKPTTYVPLKYLNANALAYIRGILYYGTYVYATSSSGA